MSPSKSLIAGSDNSDFSRNRGRFCFKLTVPLGVLMPPLSRRPSCPRQPDSAPRGIAGGHLNCGSGIHRNLSAKAVQTHVPGCHRLLHQCLQYHSTTGKRAFKHSYNAPTYGALSDYLFPGGFRDYLLTPIIMAGEPLGNQWVKKYVASVSFLMMSETHSSISASSCSRSCSVRLALSL